MNTTHLKDLDVAKQQERDLEIQEWLESLRYVIENEGEEQAFKILHALQVNAFSHGLRLPFTRNTPYINSINYHDQPLYPGDNDLERSIKSYIRWNAMAMVARANKKDSGIGGHIATFASSATLYEVGFNHFFRAPSKDYAGDLLYIQGHASPGIYARAFLEGRLTTEQLENFRRELSKNGGLPSYPHPRLLPDFWQFPTVSMGLSPIMAIYQARFAKYLEARSLKTKSGGKIWAFLGDGETDEPETLGAINLAKREQLDNLIFVINCNLQRLDGPVRGNGKIIQELEGIFRGAGWNVIKVIWGSGWDRLLDMDDNGLLKQRMEEVVDGDYQKYSTEEGSYVRQHFFGKYPELADLVKNLSDKDITYLGRGGHDPYKVYAAYKKAVSEPHDAPTVILAKTIKGYGMGMSGQGRNVTHQAKKLTDEDLIRFRNRFNIPISDEKIKELPFYKPAEDSREMQYLKKKREELGGSLPARKSDFPKLSFPDAIYTEFYESSKEREFSTTMAFVRLLTKMLRDKEQGKYVVPIVPDEARTFGMESLFSQIGIYASQGQKYEPVDKDSLLYYKESATGQLLEEGITEAGAMSSFIAAGTAYANYGLPMLPFFIYYSMFGPQRIGDLVWAAGDIMCKGFMLGATAGRTTLAGEGLQHQDGHSLVLTSTVPCMKSYDPAFAYELAVIIKDGIKRMYQDQEKIYYYITLYNENYAMPAMPKGAEEGILKGIYLFRKSSQKGPVVHLWGSGSILKDVVAAAEVLEKYAIQAHVWSVTSYEELRRDGIECDRYNRLNPLKPAKKPYISNLFEKEQGVIVAASDFMKVLPDALHRWLPLPLAALGTDGFGRSETREVLREYFENNTQHVAWAAVVELYRQGKIDKALLEKAQKDLKINSQKANPSDI